MLRNAHRNENPESSRELLSGHTAGTLPDQMLITHDPTIVALPQSAGLSSGGQTCLDAQHHSPTSHCPEKWRSTLSDTKLTQVRNPVSADADAARRLAACYQILLDLAAKHQASSDEVDPPDNVDDQMRKAISVPAEPVPPSLN